MLTLCYGCLAKRHHLPVECCGSLRDLSCVEEQKLTFVSFPVFPFVWREWPTPTLLFGMAPLSTWHVLSQPPQPVFRMDTSSGYGSWSMTSNSNPEFAWQFGANGVPQAAAASLDAVPHTSHAEFLGLHAQMMQQQPQSYQFQPAHSEYPQQVFPQYFTADATANGMSASSGVPPNPSSVDANTFHQLQAAVPSAPSGMVPDAVFHQPQQQHPGQHHQMMMHHSQSTGLQSLPQNLQSPSSFGQAPSHHTLFRSHSDSDNSLAHALTFTSPQPPPSVASSSISLAQQSLPSFSTSTGYPSVAAPSLDAPSSGNTKKKAVKLRQSKLTFLPGVAQSVVKQTPPASAPAVPSTAEPSRDGPGATGVVDSGPEPSTPPLPKAKALVAKPSTNGTANRAAVAKSGSPSAPLEGKRISDLARRYLVRLNVEQKPKATARLLVELLSDLGPNGKFLRPTPTNGEDRKIIVEALNSIAKLETGKGYTESGRKRFFVALMDLPAARHILSAWLKATAPPKKVTEATPDHSRRYKDTLLPLLNILDYVDMKSAYLTDEAAMGKSISAVVNRAVDPSAKAFANKIKAKWSKMIDEEAKGAGPARPARPASTTSGTSSTSTAAAASSKRKPDESSAAADSAKRHKPATSTPTTASASARVPKPAAGASSSANAKPGLSFFGASSARRPTSTATASTSGLASGSRTNAHQNIMSLMNMYSGGAATDRAAASTANAPQADAAAAKTKVKKRVTWKADSELVAIKLIEPAEYGQGDNDKDHVEGAGDVHDEGLALRQSLSTMEALMDWHEPREVMVTVCDAGPIGSESVEGPFQTQRSADREEKSNEADEDELVSVEELQLEQPGSISETPSELVGVENVDMPTPWMGETSVEEPGADAMDLKKEGDDASDGGETESAAPATTIAGIPSTADLSALLSLTQSVGAGANAGGTEANETGSAAAAAPAPVPNFDVDQLRSIIANARGSGSPASAASAANAANAVNAAIQASNEGPADLSSLLTSLSKTHAALPSQQSVGVHQEPNYWQHTYRGSNGSNYAPPEESYPGEYQQSYQPAGQRYGRSAPSYDYAEYTQGPSRDRGASDWGLGGRQSKHFKTPCKFFAQGTCRNGDRCTFLH